MTLYTDTIANVVAWTNRADLTAEMDLAVMQAVRAAHRAGNFFRDLVTLPLVGQPTDQIQQIDLSAVLTNSRKLATIGPTGTDLQYSEAHVLDLFDQDKYPRLNVYWVIGNTLNIRAASPSAELTITYYKHPTVSPIASLDSWIAQIYPDYIAAAAASTVLAVIGEQEIKTRVEKLAAMGLEGLIADNLFASGG